MNKDSAKQTKYFRGNQKLKVKSIDLKHIIKDEADETNQENLKVAKDKMEILDAMPYKTLKKPTPNYITLWEIKFRIKMYRYNFKIKLINLRIEIYKIIDQILNYILSSKMRCIATILSALSLIIAVISLIRF
jgi:hypothetical protein